MSQFEITIPDIRPLNNSFTGTNSFSNTVTITGAGSLDVDSTSDFSDIINVSGGQLRINTSNGLTMNQNPFTLTNAILTYTHQFVSNVNRIQTSGSVDGTTRFNHATSTRDHDVFIVGDLTIGNTGGSSNAILTFTNPTISSTLTYTTGGQFQFADDVRINSGNNFIFQSSTSSSGITWTGGQGTHRMYIDQTNGDLFTLSMESVTGNPHIKFIANGIGSLTLDYVSNIINWGTNSSTNIVHTFDGTTNGTLTFTSASGLLTWSHALTSTGAFTASSTVTFSSISNGFLTISSGVVGSQSTIDISADTNLAVTSPITLTGDTIGFNFATNNTWTGTNNFTEDTTLTASTGSGSFFYDVSTGRTLLTLPNDTSANGFEINKAESVRPTAGTPEYMDVVLTRSWSGAGTVANIFNVAVTDTSLSLTSGAHINRLFRLSYTKSGGSVSVTNNLEAMRFEISNSPAGSATASANTAVISVTGTTAPTTNSASNTSSLYYVMDCDAVFSLSNSGAGNATATFAFVNWDSGLTITASDETRDYTFFTVPVTVLQTAGTVNFGVGTFSPTITQIIGGTYNFTGFSLSPAFSSAVGGGASTGFVYSPSGSAVATWTHTAFKSTRGDWFNQADVGTGTGHHYYGAGDDCFMGYDGSNMILDPDVVGSGRVLIGATGDDDMLLTNIEIDGALNHDGSTIGFFGTTPAAQAAAYTVTNVSTDRSYDANSTTVDELADILGTLIADLKTYGLLQ